MIFHWQQITGLWDNTRVRQATTLYLASFAGIPLSIVTSIVFTRFLGPQSYGDFAFLDSLFGFARIIFPLGFFHAGNRALVLNDSPRIAREIHGATLTLLFVLFLVMSAVLVVYGLLDPNLAEKGLDRFFLYMIPFGWIFLLGPYFDNMLHADNRIYEMAGTHFFARLINFVIALGIYFLLQNFVGSRLALIWFAYLFSFFIVYTTVLVRIRVSFKRMRTRLRHVIQYYRNYGFHLYIGSLFSIGSLALTGVLISYFSDDNTGVGFFALSIAISRPLAFIPGVIATTWFKDFAKQQKASQRLILITLALTIFSLAAFFLLVGPFIRFFYSSDFLPVIPLAHTVGIGMFLFGLASFFNRFLEARGHGKYVRNIHIATGLTLLIANLILIPGYGATGAAMATILAHCVKLAGMVWTYFWTVREGNVRSN